MLHSLHFHQQFQTGYLVPVVLKKIDVKDFIQCKTMWARRNEHIKSLSEPPHCLKLNLTTFYATEAALINLISVL